MLTRQIEIDIDVHKLIEANRTSFSETPNDVLRRLLHLGERTRPSTEPIHGKGLITNNTVIPEGTKLRKILHGVEHTAEVKDGAIVYDEMKFRTPSAAACAAAKVSANGWIFWDYFDSVRGEWRRLDSLRARPAFRKRARLTAEEMEELARI